MELPTTTGVGDPRRRRYRGADRRAQPGPPTRAHGTPFIVAGLSLLVAWAGFALATRRGWGPPAGIDDAALNALLTALAAALGLGVAFMYLLRWRLVGETTSLRVGVATAMLAGGVFVARDVLPAILPSLERHETLSALCGAATLLVILLLTAALKEPEIDTDLTVRVIARRAVGGIAVLTLILVAVPDLGELLGTSPMSAAASPLARAGQAGLGSAWFLLAVAYTLRGLRVGRALHAWFGLMLFGLALAAMSGAGTTPTHMLWPIGAAVLSLVAMILAMYGATQELRRGWRAQQERLWQARVDLEREQIRHEDDELQRQERRHDARSAIVAIQAAAFVLETGDDDLDDVERAGLARSLAAEVARLQQLVENVNAATESVVFDVQTALEPTLTCHRSGDLGLLAQIPEGLQARGRPHDLARVVQNLLDNTRRHAPGSPVHVTAGLEGGNVVVRVEDRGPGVLPSELEAIFERGRRGSNAGAGGTGLGMHVARQLMREQGGDLWVEGRPGGGASFVLFLEAAPEDSVTERRTRSVAPSVTHDRPVVSGGRGA